LDEEEKIYTGAVRKEMICGEYFSWHKKSHLRLFVPGDHPFFEKSRKKDKIWSASNRFNDTIGTLAPYCFPYMVILWMMILPLLRPGAYNLYFFLLGAPVSLHLMAAITDFISQSRIREGTDIHIVGFGFSLIVVHEHPDIRDSAGNRPGGLGGDERFCGVWSVGALVGGGGSLGAGLWIAFSLAIKCQMTLYGQGKSESPILRKITER
jgi:hypothetical protein